MTEEHRSHAMLPHMIFSPGLFRFIGHPISRHSYRHLLLSKTAIVPPVSLSHCQRSLSAIRSFSSNFSTPKPVLKPVIISTPTTVDQETMTSEHIIENDTPIIELDCKSSFERLTKQERLYTHFLSKASWVGSLITLYQTSIESPIIFSLFNRIFSKQDITQLKELAASLGFSDDDWTALLVYVSSIVANMGNYKGFGDLKFVPGVDRDKLDKFIRASKAASLDPEVVSLWESCNEVMYSLEKHEKCLGFHPKGKTTYFTPNCTEDDANIVQDLLKSNAIDGYNHRCFKHENGVYEVRFASVRSTEDQEEGEFIHGKKINSPALKLTRGDYSPILEEVNKFLIEAKKYTANDIENKMIGKYIDHFRTGNLNDHKDGSRFWIKNKGPVVETYIGFIETYRDPAGLRAEFESFVSLVDKERSKAFQTLVDNAEELLKLLPWGKNFEKDKFLQPDFTSLDVVTFTGSGIPAGINIPNYDEIRQVEGFKNVSLGNVISGSLKEDKPNFLNESDAQLLKNNLKESFEVQVGLHELLGHGSGKLFKRDKDGNFNFDRQTTIDPLTKKEITSWYEDSESYDSQFGSLGSAFEECRAECVGLYLCLDPSVVKIFGFTDEVKIKEIVHANWLSMVVGGIASLRMYQTETKKWLQAHSQARYAIARVLINDAPGLVRIEQLKNSVDGKDDLLFHFDPEKINTVGKKAISDFLLKLQVLKSTGNSKGAVKLFDELTKVDDGLEYPYVKIRGIAVDRRKPRKQFVQSTTVKNEDEVSLKTYSPSLEGMIESFVNNYPEDKVTQLFKKMQQL